MGVFDDIKDSIGGSDSKNSSRPDSTSSDGSGFESGEFDDSFDPLDGSPAGEQPRQGRSSQQSGSSPRQSRDDISRDTRQQPQQPRQQQPEKQSGGGATQGRAQSQASRQSPEPQRQQRRKSSPPENSPNPQTGRPREGSTEPQLSRQTQKELENAGLSQQPQTQRSVADRMDELDEIKSQNEQIIELLKRINKVLQQSGRPQRR